MICVHIKAHALSGSCVRVMRVVSFSRACVHLEKVPLLLDATRAHLIIGKDPLGAYHMSRAIAGAKDMDMSASSSRPAVIHGLPGKTEA